jgi:conserved oligomeric Golgi complex subunit 2
VSPASIGFRPVADGIRTRGSRAKHLARVGAEYTQLLYHVSKAQTEKCAFVNECQWVSIIYLLTLAGSYVHFQKRIDRIKSTLSSDLDHLFSSTLVALTEGRDFTRNSSSSDLDKTKALSDITECLRTYDMLGLWHDAEEVLKTDVVRAFVKKVCLALC